MIPQEEKIINSSVFVDFAPTILDILNIEREFPFEGISFFKKMIENLFIFH